MLQRYVAERTPTFFVATEACGNTRKRRHTGFPYLTYVTQHYTPLSVTQPHKEAPVCRQDTEYTLKQVWELRSPQEKKPRRKPRALIKPKHPVLMRVYVDPPCHPAFPAPSLRCIYTDLHRANHPIVSSRRGPCTARTRTSETSISLTAACVQLYARARLAS